MSYLDSPNYLMGNYLMGEEPEIQESSGGQQSLVPPSNVTGQNLPIPAGLNMQGYVNLPIIGPVKVAHLIVIIAVAVGVWYVKKKSDK